MSETSFFHVTFPPYGYVEKRGGLYDSSCFRQNVTLSPYSPFSEIIDPGASESVLFNPPQFIFSHDRFFDIGVAETESNFLIRLHERRDRFLKFPESSSVLSDDAVEIDD